MALAIPLKVFREYGLQPCGGGSARTPHAPMNSEIVQLRSPGFSPLDYCEYIR
jgi:hypothetical protein